MQLVSTDENRNLLMEDSDVTVTIDSTLSDPNLKIIAIKGTVDRETSFRVDKKVLPLIEQDDAHIILDLTNLDYLSNVGMMSIVKYSVLCCDKKKLFKIVNPPISVQDNMAVFGILNKFDMYDNIEAAISTF